MDSNFLVVDDCQNYLTWDEYSDQVICQSPLLLGRPSPKQHSQFDEESDICLVRNSFIEEQQQEIILTDTVDAPIQKRSKKISKRQKNRVQIKKPPFKNEVKDVVSYINNKNLNMTQQYQSCKQIRNLIENLEIILGSIKRTIINNVSSIQQKHDC